MIRLSSSPPKTPDPSKVQDTKHQEYHNPHQYQNNLSKMAQSPYLKIEHNFIISESNCCYQPSTIIQKFKIPSIKSITLQLQFHMNNAE
ncbi:unnamed protein product [Wickerhamomyces anomalus]